MGKPFGRLRDFLGFGLFWELFVFFLMAKVTFVHLVERKGKLAEEKKKTSSSLDGVSNSETHGFLRDF